MVITWVNINGFFPYLSLFKRYFSAYAKIITMYVGFITCRHAKYDHNSAEAGREEMEVCGRDIPPLSEKWCDTTCR